MKFKPKGNRVLVRRREAETKTPGGIVIPESVQKKPFEGEVLAIGSGRLADDGVTIIPADVKPGDVVMYAKYSGMEIQLEDGPAVILGNDDILGVFEP